MAHDDDPTRAAVRVAEGVVALVRAEAGLAATRARVAGSRLALTLGWTVAAAFFSALAAIVVVLSPVIWAFRPAAAVATLALALAFAGIASLVTAKRWRGHKKTNAVEEASIPPIHHDLAGSDHAVPR
ncbi:MAG TPA: hypothetical protein VMS65_13125 [Polyangiaceae bacterium]|nr:hypothetical protein [Polyangiaceae bacterium]